MATKTLRFVSDKVRNWSSQNGTMCFFKVQFDDGEEGEVCCKESNLGNTLAKFKELVGKATEFEIQPGGTFASGDPKPAKVKLPQQQATGAGGGRSWSGGGKSWEPRWRDSAEAMAYEQERMDRRTALMQAVEYKNSSQDQRPVSVIADGMYGWLQKSKLTLAPPKPAEPAPVAVAEPPKPAPPPPPPVVPAKPQAVPEPDPQESEIPF